MRTRTTVVLVMAVFLLAVLTVSMVRAQSSGQTGVRLNCVTTISPTHFRSYDGVDVFTDYCSYIAHCEDATIKAGRPALLVFDSGAFAVIRGVRMEDPR